ncbi:hypothetical protein NXB04_25935 [Bacillus paranthracis]|uniref:hypothetical protein n=1 Tax=Bacillus paranthracis TaxID=2026186 RepID=UPI002151D0F5|nr:hypothetical protein [Bacillus paranthracis]MCR6465306.1 hypothetical protein [Bacillus paranthracis]MCR9022592.1 hypothetical protein [Bacillus paranthracis]
MTNLINGTNQETFIMDAGVREAYMNRVEVLEQVKGLLLLPKLEVASTKQVADFYEVEVDAINSINRRHREELENDGMTIIKRGNIEDFLNGQSDHIEITPYVATMMDEQGVKYSFNNRGSYVFPRRAILRVGMLLRDSEIAKEVRTQLLNIEEKTTAEI